MPEPDRRPVETAESASIHTPRSDLACSMTIRISGAICQCATIAAARCSRSSSASTASSSLAAFDMPYMRQLASH